MMNIKETEQYFIDRATELQSMCDDGTAWVFVCGFHLIKIMAGMRGYFTIPDDEIYPSYNFMKEYMSKYGVQIGDKLMLNILRSLQNLSNTFTLKINGENFIVLSHDEKHLSVRKFHGKNVFILNAYDFISDIKDSISYFFSEVERDESMAKHVEIYISMYEPLQAE